MGFQAKIILDSIGPNGIRLTSVQMTYPRFIHAEFMTHRDRARNAASSRAIPWKKLKPGVKLSSEDAVGLGDYLGHYIDNCMMKMIMTEPVVPLSFDGEQQGMQSAGPIENQAEAQRIWLEARDAAVKYADQLATLGVHKSLCNRIVEPWMWITVLCTATQWGNFFRLRCHPAAEKHFQLIASMTRNAIRNSMPTRLKSGEWHCPYLLESEQRDLKNAVHSKDEVAVDRLKKYSVARCARLSYLTHDGTINPDNDMKLVNKLLAPPGDPDEEVMHASPFEHVAEATNDARLRSGPFIGWKQFRKEFPNECLD